MNSYVRVCAIVLFSLALLIGGESRASGQDRSVGLMVAAPTLIGIDLPLSDRLAVRPGISFSRSSSDFATVSGTRTDSTTSFSFSVSLPITVKQMERTRMYIAPLFAAQGFTASSSDGRLAGTSSTLWSGGGAVGFQGDIATRLTLFGEAGFTWGSRSSSSDPDDFNNTTSQTVAKVGVIFRFK